VERSVGKCGEGKCGKLPTTFSITVNLVLLHAHARAPVSAAMAETPTIPPVSSPPHPSPQVPVNQEWHHAACCKSLDATLQKSIDYSSLAHSLLFHHTINIAKILKLEC
jgi:hypothetical protein